MSEPQRRRDRDDYDAAFADIIASWTPSDPEPDPPEPAPDPDPRPVEPLFRFTEPDPEPEELTDDDDDDFEPPPPERLPRLSVPARLGVGLLGYSLVVVLIVVAGFRPPSWLGLSAVLALVSGLVLLFSRLPWRRDPADGDGAQL